MNKTPTQRLQEKLQKIGITQKGLLLYAYRELKKRDPKHNGYDEYEKAENEKGNFTKFLNGDRNYRSDILIIMEEKLELPMCYIFNDEKVEPIFKNKGLRYIASLNQYDKFVELEEESSKGSKVIENWDEYDKNILEYIFEYDSIEGLRYLIDKNYIRMNNFSYTNDLEFNKNMSISVEKGIEKALKMIFKYDDTELFNKFLDCRILLSYEDKLPEQINKDFLSAILESNNIFNSILEDNKINLNEVNEYNKDTNTKGLFCNPLLYVLINYVLQCPDKYQSKIKKILKYGYEYNNRVLEYLKTLKIVQDSIIIKSNGKIYSEGTVYTTRKLYGNLFRPNLKGQPDITNEIQKLLTKIESQVNSIDLGTQNLLGGYSGKEIFRTKDKLYKEISNNKTEYEFLKYMEDCGFDKVPKYYGQKENKDIFTFIEGENIINNLTNSIGLSKTINIVKVLKQINELSKKKLGDNKVYVHGDLGPKNVLFNGDKVEGIIDWDDVKIGEEHEDLIYVIWTWLNLGNYDKNDEKTFENICEVIEEYNPSNELKHNFADKMIKVMDDRLSNTSTTAQSYSRIYKWVGFSKVWVELYREKITEVIG